MKKIFLDSSVIFSAVNSPFGGSAKLFTLKRISLITSQLVITEVERNVRKKLQDYHLERFFLLAGKLLIIDLPLNKKLIKKAERIIVKKDSVILSQAKQAKADIVLTLDNKHFLIDAVKKFLKPTLITTPKDFLNR